MQEQEVDVTQFEANLASYTSSIENNHRLAGERFTKAVKEIDDAIAALVKAKEDLLTAEDKLRLAEDKAKAFANGMTDYLVKPIDVDIMHSMLVKYLV